MCKSGGQQVTTNQTQTYRPDPQVQQAGYQAIGGAEQASQAPFQMPVAPVAGFSPLQEQAFGQIQGLQGMAQPYFNTGSAYLAGSAAPISGRDVANYYNPFAQNVFANMQDLFGQQMRDTTGKLTQAAGGIGADRIALGQNNLAKQQDLALGQTASGIYQNALQAAQQQKQMMAGAGFGFGQFGPAAQMAALQGTSALGQAGAQQQALAQAQQNAQYQNILARIAYPFQTPQYLAGIAGGLAPALGGTTSGQSQTNYPSPSPLSQILGIGTALAGGVGAMGGIPGFGGGSQIGPTYGATNLGGFGYGSYGGVPVPTFFNRGGPIRNPFASGGSAYGKLAQTRGMAAGNPYVDADNDNDNHYADGGRDDDPYFNIPPYDPKNPPSLADKVIATGKMAVEPAARVIRNAARRFGYDEGGEVGSLQSGATPIPKVPLSMGAGHSGPLTGGISLQHQQLPSQQKSQGDAAKGVGDAAKMAAQVLPMLALARGGMVNPYHYDEGGFLPGGDDDYDYTRDKPVATAFVPERPPVFAPTGPSGPTFDERFPKAGEIKAGSDIMADPAEAKRKLIEAGRARLPVPLPPERPEAETDELTPRSRVPSTERNPYVVANKDMTMDSIMRNPYRPYPDATQRDWGQQMVRSPWMSLVAAGARMAQSRQRGLGSIIGEGLEAGLGHLEGQRASLMKEETSNQASDRLADAARAHLDKYQRMTPYESAMSDWRQATQANKAPAQQRLAQWIARLRGISELDAYDEIHQSVTDPTRRQRIILDIAKNIPEAGGDLKKAQEIYEQMFPNRKAGTAPQKTVVRTGTVQSGPNAGKKVIEYSDGTQEVQG